MNGIDKFGRLISQRLNALDIKYPTSSVILHLCRSIQTASLITEEGRFVQGSITLANPKDPQTLPSLQRADYPSFTAFEAPIPFLPENFGKLARAVDQWSGSLVVWGSSIKSLVIWGIVDQLVGTNASLYREGSGFTNPGQLTITIDRPGDITAYHGRIYLGSLRAQKVIKSESEPLNSLIISEKITSTYLPVAQAITSVVSKASKSAPSYEAILSVLWSEWSSVLSRLCIGLRRFGTGGAFIITPKPTDKMLKIGRPFVYKRLADSLALDALDAMYAHSMSEDDLHFKKLIPRDFAWEKSFADTDLIDRQDELTGAIKLVTSLAALDGAVLLDFDLTVAGFGVKINAPSTSATLFDGRLYETVASKAPIIDQSSFGMRHISMINYCATDPLAIGVVISQDGHVRLISSNDNHLIIWDQIKLLNHSNFTSILAKREIVNRKRLTDRSRKGTKLGQSSMPKTFEHLISGISK